MPRLYQVGDRVEVVNGYRDWSVHLHYFPHGTIARVEEVVGSEMVVARVEGMEMVQDEVGSDRTQALLYSQIRLLPPTPSIRRVRRGDLVRVIANPDSFHCFVVGAILTVVVAHRNGTIDASLADESSSTVQILEPSHFELIVDPSIPPVEPLALQVGMYVRVTAVDPTSSYGRHALLIGRRARIVEFCANSALRLIQGSQTQTLTPSEYDPTPLESDEEREEAPEPEDDRHRCDNCGDRCETVCSGCERGDCCECFCRPCGDCRSCCSCGRSDNIIQDAGSRAYPAKRPLRAPYAGFLYLGVELEVECKEGSKYDVASTVKGYHAHDILIKSDGSLEEGFEMVTGPYSLEEHGKLWPTLAKNAIRAGARSWHHRSTGLHVHLSRAFFKPVGLGKLLVFLNSEHTRPMIVKLAGRESPDYAAMQKKKLTDVMKYETKYNARLDKYMPPVLTGLYGKTGNRYESLNLTNDKTVEIRIFKGTLNVDHIMADIEFCHAAAYWTVDAPIGEVESWAKFWDYVTRNRKTYPHLVKFMTGKSETTQEEN